MSKQVTNVKRGTHQPYKHSLEKEMVVIECGDDSKYIFEKTDSNPDGKFRLARRVKPSGKISTSGAMLPSAVKETIETAVSGWYK